MVSADETRESVGTVVSAGAANLVIAASTLAAGVLSGSAKVDFTDGAHIETAADLARQRLTSRLPQISHVFLDPTGAPERASRRDEGPVG